jgi:hypothetical protein
MRRGRFSAPAHSFEHPVGAQQDRLRNPDGEGFRGPRIHDQLELGRLLDRQTAGFAPLNIRSTKKAARR